MKAGEAAKAVGALSGKRAAIAHILLERIIGHTRIHEDQEHKHSAG